jgi:hypothetical protein
MLLTSTYYLSLLLVILLSLFQIGGQLMEQAATIAAAREDTSEASSTPQLGEGGPEVCSGKMETSMMKMKKHRISLEEAVAASGPGAGTGVKGMTWEDLDVIEPFTFDEPDAISIHCQGWPV